MKTMHLDGLMRSKHWYTGFTCINTYYSTTAVLNGQEGLKNLISSFLPQLSDEKNIGRISGYGWALGYVGGLLSLLICLAYLTSRKTSEGYPEVAVRATCLFTAGFFLVKTSSGKIHIAGDVIKYNKQ